MKLSFNWLKTFVPFRGSAEKLAERLSLSGTEVEAIMPLSRGLQHLVVGEVQTLVQHPRADRLKIAKVRVGRTPPLPEGSGGVGALSIVCGAPNIKPGQKVVVAGVGTKLPGGVVIERRMIRGIASEGMICGPDEVGLGPKTGGILVLGKDAEPGMALEQALGFDDTVLDLALTPNRGDCLSVLGIAREVSAVTEAKLRWQPPTPPKPSGATPMRMTVRDKIACPSYRAYLLRNVHVTASPQWLRNRLTAIGITPVNNVVDVTNYVMAELGQPMHAFDANRVGSSVIVRRARRGEKLTALNGQSYVLDPSLLVIADARKPIALAGLMGGFESQITKKTGSIILEVARFHPGIIRAMSQKLHLRSESSYRFERGIDPEIATVAADRAVTLLMELAGAKPIGRGVTVTAKPAPLRRISLSLDAANALLGSAVARTRAESILRSLGFSIVQGKGSLLIVTVPSWRSDVRISVDLTEEIGRIVGYGSLTPTLPTATLRPRTLAPAAAFERELRRRLVAQGLTEVLKYSTLSGDRIRAAGSDPALWLKISNPLSREQEYLRATLTPHMAESLSVNERYRDDVALFEIGTTFLRGKPGTLPVQERHVAVGVLGNEAFRRVKGHVEALFQAMGAANVAWDERGGHLEVRIGKVVVGAVSTPKASLRNMLNVRRESATAELSLPLLLRVQRARTYEPPSPYQPVIRDASVWLPASVRFGVVADAVRTLSPLIVDLDVFDVFSDRKASERKSIAFHVVFQSRERTLTSEEVERVMDRMRQLITERFGGEIRKS